MNRSEARAGPAAAAWRNIRQNPPAFAGLIVLGILYTLAAFAPFVSAFNPERMDRERFYHPPQRLHWVRPDGNFALRPFVYATRLADAGEMRYAEDRTHPVELQWLTHGEPYRMLAMFSCDRHLYGVKPGEPPVYLLGADGFGRDVLSRLLFGAQVSLTVGLVGILISFSLGLLLGGISGYLGGWVDALIMRSSELLLSIPGLYLILALRTLFPIQLPSQQIYLAIVAILSLIGWAALARVIRGMVLSIRRADFVTAAEALGMGWWRVLVRHVLPNTVSYVIVAATLAVPGYILAEVFLSFLGVGVQEPAASWGNMLNQARSLRVLDSFPWLLYAPAVAIFLTVLAFNVLGDGLRDALDPRGVGETHRL